VAQCFGAALTTIFQFGFSHEGDCGVHHELVGEPRPRPENECGLFSLVLNQL
jgi:hypothetical protein